MVEEAAERDRILQVGILTRQTTDDRLVMKYRRRLQAIGTVWINMTFVRKFRAISAGKELPAGTAGKCNQQEY
jgi:hypothetical protein